MSIHSNQCKNLRLLLQRHSGHEHAVIDTFCHTLLDDEWDDGELLEMLDGSKGISEQGDLWLDRYMNSIKMG